MRSAGTTVCAARTWLRGFWAIPCGPRWVPGTSGPAVCVHCAAVDVSLRLCCVCECTVLETSSAAAMDELLYKPVQDLCIRTVMLLRRGLHSMRTHFIFTVCCGYSALVSGTATGALPLPGWDNWDCSLRNCPKGHTADRRNGIPFYFLFIPYL
jgi:hypothetical protein